MPAPVGSTRMPVSPTTSGNELVAAATTGTFAAIASSAGRPNPSYREGTTTAAADATRPGMTSSGRRPTSATPGIPSKRSLRRRCGGPARTRLSPGRSRRTSGHASAKASRFFRRDAPPACSTYSSGMPNDRRMSLGSGSASKNRSSTPLCTTCGSVIPSSSTASRALNSETQITAAARRASSIAEGTGDDSSGKRHATTSWMVITSAPGAGGSSRFIRCVTVSRPYSSLPSARRDAGEADVAHPTGRRRLPGSVDRSERTTSRRTCQPRSSTDCNPVEARRATCS